MNFSEYARMLYPYLGNDSTQPIFISDLVWYMVREPRTEEEKRLASQFRYYPLQASVSAEHDSQQSTREKIFSGMRKLPVKDATFIYKHFDKTKFAKYLSEEITEENREKELIQDLKTYGINVPEEDKCIETTVEVAWHIIKSRSLGNNDFDFVSNGQVLSGYKLPGVPIPTVFINNGMLYVNGIEKKLSDKLPIPNDTSDVEERYVNALYEVYSEISGQNILRQKDVEKLSKEYVQHFSEQRESFFDAEYLRQIARETLIDGEEQFDILEDDLFRGIRRTYRKEYDSGYNRLESVLDRSQEIQLTESKLNLVLNGVGNTAREGLCHELVHDGKIKSWVDKDE